MKILLISDQFPPAIDGVGDYTFHLAREWVASGCTVIVVCREAEHKTTGKCPVRVFSVVQRWNAAGYRRVSTVMDAEQPDFILLQYVPHGFQAKGLPVLLPFFFRKWCGQTNSGVFFHEVRVRWEWRSPKTWLVAVVEHLLSRMLHQSANLRMTSIPAYADILPADTHIIPIGANILPVFTEQGQQEALRRRFVPEYAAPVIIAFGNRDHRPLYVAFRQLQSKFPKACLLVCGKTMHPITGDGIVHIGIQPPETLGVVLGFGDVLVLPDSSVGGTSNKSGSLAAALASGCAVVGIRGNMNGPLLQHGVNIWLADRPDPPCLLEALEKLLKDQTLRARLASEAKRTFEKHLTWSTIAGKQLELIRKVTQRSIH
ncbi:MAG: glycosyltransferase [Saprospiraceae bacterium]|nr:glycosyltransferase [Saprospiraceae bacterium]